MSDGDYPASNSAKANSTQESFLFEHDIRADYEFAGEKSTEKPGQIARYNTIRRIFNRP